MRTLIALFIAANLFSTGKLFAADAAPQRKTAIIVENRAGEQFNDKVSVLEDLLSTRVAGKGYSVISRDVTVNALKSYSAAGITVSSKSSANVKSGSTSDHAAVSLEANAGQKDTAAQGVSQSAEANASKSKYNDNYQDTWKPEDSKKTKTYAENEKDNYSDADAATHASVGVNATHEESSDAALNAKMKSSARQDSATMEGASSDSMHVAVTPDSTALDDALNNNTSALRLAQNLGADFILIPAITSYGTEKKTYNGNGISTVNVMHTLRVSYKIVEAGMGGAMQGGMVVATKNIRQTEGLQTEDSDLINGLLDDAAMQLADAIAENAKTLPTEIAKAKMVSFSVACTMTDPRQQPIMISTPEVKDKRVVEKNPPVAVQAMDVTVELDGVALGSTPGQFKAQPGLHKISLSREGFDTWSRTINIYDGQTLSVALQMSEDGYARWADTTAFLATLDANRKLTDAEVNKINGLAEFFKNSHYRVDTKENTKVDNNIIVR
ncbi:MAG TPA: PEGA domain-containing protein [Methylomirabilota bacterium]|nr:PEGA domain-containing protein [Methylomirabilota bacterium]